MTSELSGFTATGVTYKQGPITLDEDIFGLLRGLTHIFLAISLQDFGDGLWNNINLGHKTTTLLHTGPGPGYSHQQIAPCPEAERAPVTCAVACMTPSSPGDICVPWWALSPFAVHHDSGCLLASKDFHGLQWTLGWRRFEYEHEPIFLVLTGFLSNTSEFIHVVACDKISFFLKQNNNLVHTCV